MELPNILVNLANQIIVIAIKSLQIRTNSSIARQFPRFLNSIKFLFAEPFAFRNAGGNIRRKEGGECLVVLAISAGRLTLFCM